MGKTTSRDLQGEGSGDNWAARKRRQVEWQEQNRNTTLRGQHNYALSTAEYHFQSTVKNFNNGHYDHIRNEFQSVHVIGSRAYATRQITRFQNGVVTPE